MPARPGMAREAHRPRSSGNAHFMTQAQPKVGRRPGPKPTPLYYCVCCDAELGARSVRIHRRNCSRRSIFCANQDGPRKPGPTPKIHYLCITCLASLSETDVRTHHHDCPGKPEPALVERLDQRNTRATRAQLRATLVLGKARIAELEQRQAELERRASRHSQYET